MKSVQISAYRPTATVALAGSVLLGSLGVSVVTVALPSLANAFSAPVPSVQWVILAYLLASTVTVVLAGKLGDMLGHRRVLLSGLVIFTVASALCALAPSLALLAAARAVQGVGAAVLMAIPMSIMKETVGKEKLGSAMGLFGTMSAVGTALGPSLGGVLLSGFGWRSVFMPLAVIGAVTLALSMATIPHDAQRAWKDSPRVDWFGAFLLAVALVSYSLSVSKAAATTGVAGMFPIAAVTALAAFVFVEIKTAFPLIPLSILRGRAAAVALSTNLILSTVMMTTLVVGPFYLSLSLGLSEGLIGLVMSVGPVVAALTGVAAGRAVDRFGSTAVMVAGLVETMVGFTALALLPRYIGIPGYVLSLVILTPGFQMFLAANGAALMAAASDSQRGMLSGLLGLSRNLGFVTGASAMATLFAFAVGEENMLRANQEAVADGFSVTFLSAAALTSFAMMIAFMGVRKVRRRNSDAS